MEELTGIKFPDDYFQNETRCNFHITGMMKRLWAVQIELLSWIDKVCKKYDIKYIMCYGSMLGTVRHKGYIPWDDDIDVAMLRADYTRFLEAVAKELPPYLSTKSLLPGAIPPKEMTFNIGNGKYLSTAPDFLERFHGCPYITGIDVFVFDRVPTDPEEFKYQDRLIRLLDRMLMLQWEVDDNTISSDNRSQYEQIRNTIEYELDYSFDEKESMSIQILRMLDLACSICEECGSAHVENREQVIYYGEKYYLEEYFTDRIFIPYEGIMDVPIPRKYDEALRKIFGDYQVPRKHTSQHAYPIYINQREFLYKEHKRRGGSVPEVYLEYDENGKLIVDPNDPE